MPEIARRGSAERPPSATHFGLALLALAAGLACLLALVVLGHRSAWWSGSLVGPLMAARLRYMTIAVISCAVVFGVLGVGDLLGWRRRGAARPLLRSANQPLDIRRVLVRLLGLAATLACIALVYWLFPEYRGSFYNPFWDFLTCLAGPFCLLVVPYFIWMDRRQQDAQDAYWQLGMWLLGRRCWPAAESQLAAHFAAWTVKAFFLPLMVVYLEGEIRSVDRTYLALTSDNLGLYHFLYEVSYAIDLLFCVVGYTVTLRLFDSQVRSTEPTTFGWVIALLCYQPFNSVISGTYLKYDDSIFWDNWLAPWPLLRTAWAVAIILLLFVYSLSTVSFGLRFSNLTYRGIITSGPYRFCKHPAYLSKNLSWWLISVPWLSNQGIFEAFRNCCLLVLLNGVYYLRAKTEERHLGLRDPDYVAYALWIDQHGLLSGLGRWLPALRYRPPSHPIDGACASPGDGAKV